MAEKVIGDLQLFCTAYILIQSFKEFPFVHVNHQGLLTYLK